MTVSAERLRASRERRPGRQGRPLSREALAGRLGLSTTTLQKWERVGIPNEDVLPSLARELDVSLDYLFGLTEDPTPRWKGSASADAPARADAEGAAAVDLPDDVTAAMRAVDELVDQAPPPPPRPLAPKASARGRARG